jgi:hypothetical protein
MAKCDFVTEKGKRTCKLEAGHEGQHKTAIRNKPLPQGFSLKRVKVPSDQIQASSRGSSGKPRGKEQQEVDKDLKTAYETWVKMGKPSPSDFFNHQVAENFTYVVPPSAEAAVLDMLRLGTGSGAPLHGKSFRYRKGTHRSGNVAIRFVAIDPPPKDEKK